MIPAFNPPRWLRNSHTQTILSEFMAIGKQCVQLEHNCFSLPRFSRRLALMQPLSQRPIKLIVPGIEGSYRSAVVKLLLCDNKLASDDLYILSHKNIQPDIKNTPHMYHGAWLDDLVRAVGVLRDHYNNRPIHAVGYSLGANMLLNFLANYPGAIDCVTAISTPFSLMASVNKTPAFYQRMILRGMRRRIQSKHIDKRALVARLDWRAIRSIKDFDAVVTAPYFGFSSVQEYYHRASCQHVLSKINTPVLLINAKDDPFIPVDSLPLESDLPKNFHCQFSRYGGHVGFVQWQQKRLSVWLTDALLAYEKSIIG